MSRGFSVEVAAALTQPNVSLVSFVKLEFEEIWYVHNSIGTYSWGGQTWHGLGDLGQISQVEEGKSVSPYAITLTLSGLNSEIQAAALTENYFLNPVEVYLGVLDENDELITDPSPIWSGYMDQMNLTVGASGGDAIQLVCESELSIFNRSRNLMYTNVAQQEKSSTDLFFSFLHKIEGAKVDWGSKGVTGGGVGTPRGPEERQPQYMR